MTALPGRRRFLKAIAAAAAAPAAVRPQDLAIGVGKTWASPPSVMPGGGSAGAPVPASGLPWYRRAWNRLISPLGQEAAWRQTGVHTLDVDLAALRSTSLSWKYGTQRHRNFRRHMENERFEVDLHQSGYFDI